LTDTDSFPKKSQVPEGNVSEPGTLEKVLATVSVATKKPVIVTDAGIGTQDNIEWLAGNNYHYIVVSRIGIKICMDTKSTFTLND